MAYIGKDLNDIATANNAVDWADLTNSKSSHCSTQQ